MSGDPQQEYFSDGITEDLITDLSNVSGLFVLSRNAVFRHKGKPADMDQIAASWARAISCTAACARRAPGCASPRS